MPEKETKAMKEQEREFKGIHIVTTHDVPGHAIEEVKGFVWGTTVRAKFFGQDLIAMIHILVGGEIWPYTRMVNEAKHHVIQRLVQNAKDLGADGVVGVELGSSQIFPGTIEFFAYGTAVKLKKLD